MPTFFITYNIAPMPTSQHYAKISGGQAHVWVVDDDQERAETRAIDYVHGEHWEIDDTERIHLVHREACTYDADVLALFDKAQRFGISAMFVVGVGGGPLFN